ncbi:acyl carrier protein [Streptomyces californicus]|uniref:acyl carrier protein n=1 Tax=Streptomyces californicus TaxID=67351 RepID=UPI00382E03B8
MNAAADCTPASERDDVLVRAIAGIDTTLLDCIQVNAAVLADTEHGPDTHLEIGSVVDFAPRHSTHSALPTVERQPSEQIAQLGAPLGLDLRIGEPVDRGQSLLDLIPPHRGALYVIGDAYRMPWLPYHGHQHMAHSVLLRASADGARIEAVDAYDNETPYGRAEPVVCTYTRQQAAALFDGSPTTPVLTHRGESRPQPLEHVLTRNARAATPMLETEAPEHYAIAFRDHPDQTAAFTALLLETWLLSRSRRLHAKWLARRSPGSAHAAAVAQQAGAWEDLTGQCYLAARRVQRGRPAPPQLHTTLAQLLRTDLEIAADAAPSAPGDDLTDSAEVRHTVQAVIADVMAIDLNLVAATDDLSQLEGFASFQMVETVERLEETYALEFPASELQPATLRSIDALTSLVQRATRKQAVSAA